MDNSTPQKDPAAVDPGKANPDYPTEVTHDPNLSTEHQRSGDARRPSETLDRGQPPSEETIPRKSSLL